MYMEIGDRWGWKALSWPPMWSQGQLLANPCQLGSGVPDWVGDHFYSAYCSHQSEWLLEELDSPLGTLYSRSLSGQEHWLNGTLARGGQIDGIPMWPNCPKRDGGQGPLRHCPDGSWNWFRAQFLSSPCLISNQQPSSANMLLLQSLYTFLIFCRR